MVELDIRHVEIKFERHSDLMTIFRIMKITSTHRGTVIWDHEELSHDTHSHTPMGNSQTFITHFIQICLCSKQWIDQVQSSIAFEPARESKTALTFQLPNGLAAYL